ncbi:hypothetical protein AWC38_SpisGene15206 [Stylophora pistillata]|uniref:UBX domain-containing protein n=1 Tax=Stylophora pistillata TaxID=50429 RepID=A0A2B4RVI9_STYPI|nr:hypothetical protein AWC38_SpisGene15206 [Stylophora pistillata]
MLAVKRFVDSQLNPKASKDKVKTREERKKELYERIISKTKQKKATSTSSQNVGSQPNAPAIKRTRHISLGWLHYNTKKNRYVPVRYSRGGGSREVNLTSTSSIEDILECAKKLFFPDGVSELGRDSEMTFNVGNFKEEIIADIKDGPNFMPFTLEAYFKVFKLSRVRLYLMTKKICVQERDSDDVDDFLTSSSLLEGTSHGHDEGSEDEKELPSLSDFLQETNTTECKHEDQEESSPSKSILIGSSCQRDALKSLHEKAYNDSLAADQKKAQKEREKEEEYSRRESLRLARKRRVTEEPNVNEEHILVRVRHSDKGMIRWRFRPSSKMREVYDWVGSLGRTPEHFELSVQPACAIAPDEPVMVVEGKMVQIGVVENPIPMSKEDQDVTFLGFGPDRDELPNETIIDLGSMDTRFLICLLFLNLQSKSNEDQDVTFLGRAPDRHELPHDMIDLRPVNEDIPSKLLSEDESCGNSDSDDEEPALAQSARALEFYDANLSC